MSFKNLSKSSLFHVHPNNHSVWDKANANSLTAKRHGHSGPGHDLINKIWHSIWLNFVLVGVGDQLGVCTVCFSYMFLFLVVVVVAVVAANVRSFSFCQTDITEQQSGSSFNHHFSLAKSHPYPHPPSKNTPSTLSSANWHQSTDHLLPWNSIKRLWWYHLGA